MQRFTFISLCVSSLLIAGCSGLVGTDPIAAFKTFVGEVEPRLQAHYQDKGGLTSPLKFDVQETTSAISPYSATLTYGYESKSDDGEIVMVNAVTVDYLHGDSGWIMNNYNEKIADVRIAGNLPTSMKNDIKRQSVGKSHEFSRERLDQALEADLLAALRGVESPSGGL